MFYGFPDGNLAGGAAESWGRVMSPARIWMQPPCAQQFKTLYQPAFITIMFLKHMQVDLCVCPGVLWMQMYCTALVLFLHCGCTGLQMHLTLQHINEVNFTPSYPYPSLSFPTLHCTVHKPIFKIIATTFTFEYCTTIWDIFNPFASFSYAWILSMDICVMSISMNKGFFSHSKCISLPWWEVLVLIGDMLTTCQYGLSPKDRSKFKILKSIPCC